jgi:hypothetical protein
MARRNRSGLPEYCSWNYDRHGKRRVRFRKRGFSTYILGLPWSDDFMRQYSAALEGMRVQMSGVGESRTISGSVNSIIAAYLDCSSASTSPFKRAAPETQRTRRNILENFRRAYGDLPVYRMVGDKRVMVLTREHVQRIVNKKAGTPFAQRNFLNTLRAMFQWAMKEGRIPDNPTLGTTREKVKTAGYKTWSEAEIERFETTHLIGTKARLAFALLLYTGQRRSDVVQMGPEVAPKGGAGLADWRKFKMMS